MAHDKAYEIVNVYPGSTQKEVPGKKIFLFYSVIDSHVGIFERDFNKLRDQWADRGRAGNGLTVYTAVPPYTAKNPIPPMNHEEIRMWLDQHCDWIEKVFDDCLENGAVFFDFTNPVSGNKKDHAQFLKTQFRRAMERHFNFGSKVFLRLEDDGLLTEELTEQLIGVSYIHPFRSLKQACGTATKLLNMDKGKYSRLFEEHYNRKPLSKGPVHLVEDVDEITDANETLVGNS